MSDVTLNEYLDRTIREHEELIDQARAREQVITILAAEVGRDLTGLTFVGAAQSNGSKSVGYSTRPGEFFAMKPYRAMAILLGRRGSRATMSTADFAEQLKLGGLTLPLSSVGIAASRAAATFVKVGNSDNGGGALWGLRSEFPEAGAAPRRTRRSRKQREAEVASSGQTPPEPSTDMSISNPALGNLPIA